MQRTDSFQKPSTTLAPPPRTYSQLKSWIQLHYESLPKRLQSVAVFALDNPEMIALNTIAKISEKAEVTDSTLVRFAKSIGYEGFTDMQKVFQESMRYIPQPYSERITQLENDSQPEQSVLHKFSHAASSSILKLEQQISEKAILKASEVLSEARTIYIAGEGRALPVSTYLHYNFLKMGIQAVLINGLKDTMAQKAKLIRSDEALIAITFSPYSAYTKEIAEICLTNEIPVIALTDSTLSPIACSDELQFEVLEDEISGIRGLSATMCLALCLAVETGKFISKKQSER